MPKVMATVLGLFMMVGFGRASGEDRPMTETSNSQYRAMGYVVVTPGGPQDGGDFGPGTPGTKTSGIQEAIDSAKAHYKNVFIAGVQGDRNAPVYNTQATIRVPPMQGFRIDSGECVINYTQPTGDALRIDSAMDCWYRFGLVVSRSSDAVVRLKPENPVPIDNFVVLTDSVFEFSSVVGAGTFDLQTLKITGAPGGGGIVLDASLGPILWNRIFATAVLLCDKGVYLTNGGSGNALAFNWIQVLHNHQCNTHLQLGDPAKGAAVTCNRIDMSINSEGIEGSVGARIFGRRNLFTLDVLQTAEGKNIIFEPESRENIVTALNLPNGVTNNAKIPTNGIVSGAPVGFQVETPAVPPSGECLMNRNPYPVEVIILTPGNVTDWTLTDAREESQTVTGALRAGERFILQPGESISFTYATAPTWRWRALQ